MSSHDKRHGVHRGGAQGHGRHSDCFGDSAGFMDETDREVSSLTDRAFRSLCIGEEAVYNDSSPVGRYQAFVDGARGHEAAKGVAGATCEGEPAGTRGPAPPTVRRSATDEAAVAKREHHSNGAIEATWQRRSSVDAAVTSQESTYHWGGSALLSIQKELSEFSSVYHQSMASGSLTQTRSHFHSSEVAAGPQMPPVTESFASSSTFLKSSCSFKASGTRNFFLHSESSPFQTWKEYNRLPYGRDARPRVPSPCQPPPRWYDSPFYRELTVAHRAQMAHLEERESHRKQYDDVILAGPPVPPVRQKAAAIEKRSESEVTVACPPWKRRQEPVKNKFPQNRPCTASPLADKSRRKEDALVPTGRVSASKLKVQTVADEWTSNSGTPFSISQLLTPTIHPRQGTDTSEILLYAHSPSVLDTSIPFESDPRPTPEIKPRNKYKAMASSLLFNLKDNRKRVKSTYTPTMFKSAEIADHSKQPSQLDSLIAKEAGVLSDTPLSWAGALVRSNITDLLSVSSPVAQNPRTQAVTTVRRSESSRSDDYLTLISPKTVKEASRHRSFSYTAQEGWSFRDQIGRHVDSLFMAPKSNETPSRQIADTSSWKGSEIGSQREQDMTYKVPDAPGLSQSFTRMENEVKDIHFNKRDVVPASRVSEHVENTKTGKLYECELEVDANLVKNNTIKETGVFRMENVSMIGDIAALLERDKQLLGGGNIEKENAVVIGRALGNKNELLANVEKGNAKQELITTKEKQQTQSELFRKNYRDNVAANKGLLPMREIQYTPDEAFARNEQAKQGVPVTRENKPVKNEFVVQEQDGIYLQGQARQCIPSRADKRNGANDTFVISQHEKTGLELSQRVTKDSKHLSIEPFAVTDLNPKQVQTANEKNAPSVSETAHQDKCVTPSARAVRHAPIEELARKDRELEKQRLTTETAEAKPEPVKVWALIKQYEGSLGNGNRSGAKGPFASEEGKGTDVGGVLDRRANNAPPVTVAEQCKALRMPPPDITAPSDAVEQRRGLDADLPAASDWERAAKDMQPLRRSRQVFNETLLPKAHEAVLVRQKAQTRQEILTSKLKAHAEKEIYAIREKGQALLEAHLAKQKELYMPGKKEGEPLFAEHIRKSMVPVEENRVAKQDSTSVKKMDGRFEASITQRISPSGELAKSVIAGDGDDRLAKPEPTTREKEHPRNYIIAKTEKISIRQEELQSIARAKIEAIAGGRLQLPKRAAEENGDVHQTSPPSSVAYQTSPSRNNAHCVSPPRDNAHRTSPLRGDARQISPSRNDAHQTSPPRADAHQTSPLRADAHRISLSRGDAHQMSPSRGDAHRTSPSSLLGNVKNVTTAASVPLSQAEAEGAKNKHAHAVEERGGVKTEVPPETQESVWILGPTVGRAEAQNVLLNKELNSVSQASSMPVAHTKNETRNRQVAEEIFSRKENEGDTGAAPANEELGRAKHPTAEQVEIKATANHDKHKGATTPVTIEKEGARNYLSVGKESVAVRPEVPPSLEHRGKNNIESNETRLVREVADVGEEGQAENETAASHETNQVRLDPLASKKNERADNDALVIKIGLPQEEISPETDTKTEAITENQRQEPTCELANKDGGSIMCELPRPSEIEERARETPLTVCENPPAKPVDFTTRETEDDKSNALTEERISCETFVDQESDMCKLVEEECAKHVVQSYERKPSVEHIRIKIISHDEIPQVCESIFAVDSYSERQTGRLAESQNERGHAERDRPRNTEELDVKQEEVPPVARVQSEALAISENLQDDAEPENRHKGHAEINISQSTEKQDLKEERNAVNDNCLVNQEPVATKEAECENYELAKKANTYVGEDAPPSVAHIRIKIISHDVNQPDTERMVSLENSESVSLHGNQQFKLHFLGSGRSESPEDKVSETPEGIQIEPEELSPETGAEAEAVVLTQRHEVTHESVDEDRDTLLHDLPSVDKVNATNENRLTESEVVSPRESEDKRTDEERMDVIVLPPVVCVTTEAAAEEETYGDEQGIAEKGEKDQAKSSVPTGEGEVNFKQDELSVKHNRILILPTDEAVQIRGSTVATEKEQSIDETTEWVQVDLDSHVDTKNERAEENAFGSGERIGDGQEGYPLLTINESNAVMENHRHENVREILDGKDVVNRAPTRREEESIKNKMAESDETYLPELQVLATLRMKDVKAESAVKEEAVNFGRDVPLSLESPEGKTDQVSENEPVIVEVRDTGRGEHAKSDVSEETNKRDTTVDKERLSDGQEEFSLVAHLKAEVKAHYQPKQELASKVTESLIQELPLPREDENEITAKHQKASDSVSETHQAKQDMLPTRNIEFSEDTPTNKKTDGVKREEKEHIQKETHSTKNDQVSPGHTTGGQREHSGSFEHANKEEVNAREEEHSLTQLSKTIAVGELHQAKRDIEMRDRVNVVQDRAPAGEREYLGNKTIAVTENHSARQGVSMMGEGDAKNVAVMNKGCDRVKVQVLPVKQTERPRSVRSVTDKIHQAVLANRNGSQDSSLKTKSDVDESVMGGESHRCQKEVLSTRERPYPQSPIPSDENLQLKLEALARRRKEKVERYTRANSDGRNSRQGEHTRTGTRTVDKNNLAKYGLVIDDEGRITYGISSREKENIRNVTTTARRSPLVKMEISALGNNEHSKRDKLVSGEAAGVRCRETASRGGEHGRSEMRDVGDHLVKHVLENKQMGRSNPSPLPSKSMRHESTSAHDKAQAKMVLAMSQRQDTRNFGETNKVGDRAVTSQNETSIGSANHKSNHGLLGAIAEKASNRHGHTNTERTEDRHDVVSQMEKENYEKQVTEKERQSLRRETESKEGEYTKPEVVPSNRSINRQGEPSSSQKGPTILDYLLEKDRGRSKQTEYEIKEPDTIKKEVHTTKDPTKMDVLELKEELIKNEGFARRGNATVSTTAKKDREVAENRESGGKGIGSVPPEVPVRKYKVPAENTFTVRDAHQRKQASDEAVEPKKEEMFSRRYRSLSENLKEHSEHKVLVTKDHPKQEATLVALTDRSNQEIIRTKEREPVRSKPFAIRGKGETAAYGLPTDTDYAKTEECAVEGKNSNKQEVLAEQNQSLSENIRIIKEKDLSKSAPDSVKECIKRVTISSREDARQEPLAKTGTAPAKAEVFSANENIRKHPEVHASTEKARYHSGKEALGSLQIQGYNSKHPVSEEIGDSHTRNVVPGANSKTEMEALSNTQNERQETVTIREREREAIAIRERRAKERAFARQKQQLYDKEALLKQEYGAHKKLPVKDKTDMRLEFRPQFLKEDSKKEAVPKQEYAAHKILPVKIKTDVRHEFRPQFVKEDAKKEALPQPEYAAPKTLPVKETTDVRHEFRSQFEKEHTKQEALVNNLKDGSGIAARSVPARNVEGQITHEPRSRYAAPPPLPLQANDWRGAPVSSQPIGRANSPSSKESYLTVGDALQSPEEEYKMHPSLRSVPNQTAKGSGGMNAVEEVRRDAGKAGEAWQYYAINNHEKNVETGDRPATSSHGYERTSRAEPGGLIHAELSEGGSAQSLPDYTKAPTPTPRSSTSSPSLGRPLFKVKDNSLRASPLAKSVKPSFYKTFGDDQRLGSSQENLSVPDQGDGGCDHLREQADVPVLHDTPAPSSQIPRSREPPGQNLLPSPDFTTARALQAHNALSAPEFTAPQEQPAPSLAPPTAFMSTREPRGYYRRNRRLEEDGRNSVVSTMSEDMESCGTSAYLENPNERPESACSDMRPLGKPPTVPPKSEKALRRAKRLTSRRIQKGEGPAGGVGEGPGEQKPLRAVASMPSSPTEVPMYRRAAQPSAMPQYCVEPGYTPRAGLVAQLTQRKLLQDPNSGQFFVVDMPVQLKTKMFFDPETGKYVQLSVRQSPDATRSNASSVELVNPPPPPPPYVLYPGFLPVPVSSLPPLRSSSQMSAPAALAEETEKRGDDPWRREAVRRNCGGKPEPYIEPACRSCDQPAERPANGVERGGVSQRNLNIIPMSELEDFAMESA